MGIDSPTPNEETRSVESWSEKAGRFAFSVSPQEAAVFELKKYKGKKLNFIAKELSISAADVRRISASVIAKRERAQSKHEALIRRRVNSGDPHVPLEALGLEWRVFNALVRKGYRTVDDVIDKVNEGWNFYRGRHRLEVECRNFGEKSLAALLIALEPFDYNKLGGE